MNYVNFSYTLNNDYLPLIMDRRRIHCWLYEQIDVCYNYLPVDPHPPHKPGDPTT